MDMGRMPVEERRLVPSVIRLATTVTAAATRLSV